MEHENTATPPASPPALVIDTRGRGDKDLIVTGGNLHMRVDFDDVDHIAVAHEIGLVVDAVNAHAQLQAELVAARKRITELEPAAECWDALCACYRITCMGSAGLLAPQNHGYAHATFNLWTVNTEGRKLIEADQGEQDTQGRVRLSEFIAIALKNAALAPVKS